MLISRDDTLCIDLLSVGFESSSDERETLSNSEMYAFFFSLNHNTAETTEKIFFEERKEAVQ